MQNKWYVFQNTKLFTRFQLLTFYNSYFKSSIECGRLISGSACKTHLNKYFRCQERICRIISFENRIDHITIFTHTNPILSVFELWLSAVFIEMFQELREIFSLIILAWHEKQNKQNTRRNKNAMLPPAGSCSAIDEKSLQSHLRKADNFAQNLCLIPSDLKSMSNTTFSTFF